MITQQQDQIIRRQSKNESEYNDNVACFLTFGHLFNGNILVCLSQTYCTKGKPGLNADAMGGIVRNWIDPTTGRKVCAFLKAEVLTPVQMEDGNIDPSTFGITYTAMRSDELEFAKEYGFDAPVHKWTYTMKDAIMRNVQNRRVWQEMPLVMCGKRALTAICRMVFPDVIGTANSPDELAEMMLSDDDEITRIALQSNGERIPHNLKKKSNVSKPPSPIEAPSRTKVVEVPAPTPKRTFFIRDFTNINTVIQELSDQNIDIDDAVLALENYSDGVKPINMTEDHFKRYFYRVMFSPARVILKEGRLSGFNAAGLEGQDVDTLAALFSAFYGTCPDKDESNLDYCVRIMNISHSPVFSEIARYVQRCVSNKLIEEGQQRKILETVMNPNNLFNFDLHDQILNDLPIIE